MGTKSKKARESSEQADGLAAVRAIAPEDVSPGMYVTVMSMVEEHMPMFIMDEARFQDVELLRLEWMHCAAGHPLRVIDVCIPFVFVELPRGEPEMLDLRRCRLSRVPKRFARRVRKRLAKKSKKKKS